MLNQIEASFKKVFDPKLVDELLAAYQEAKHNYYIGGLRLSAVEGGRFCEAAFRMLEQQTTAKFTDLNRPLDSETIIKKLENISSAAAPDAVRIHIPRSLRVVYDIRNKRDAAHLADGIDPNLQDATLVIAVLDWVLAEFLRLHHSVSAAQAQEIITGLVVRKAPAVEDFDGFLKILKPELKVSGYILLLLYERRQSGATFKEIETWIHPSMRKNLQRALDQQVHDKAYVHFSGDRYFLTKLGAAEVERKTLHQ
jgi:hypothetical protein